MIKRFLAVIVFFGFFQFAYGQDCSAVLDEAKAEFEDGHLEIISTILNDCLSGNDLNDDQKVDAYRLLTISNLYLDKHYEAEQSFMKLLEIDHEYRILPTDPIELQYLSKKFITTPIFSFSGKLGANMSIVSVLHRNTVSAEADNNWKYTPKFGFNALVGMDLHFNKVVSLNIEAELSSRSYLYRDVLFASEPQDITQTRINLQGSLPVSLKFTYPGETYYPYVYGGYSPNYTFISQVDNKRLPEASENIDASSFSLLGKTKDFSHSLIFGVGVKRRFKYNYVFADFRYRLGMTNMLDEANQYDITNKNILAEIFRDLQIGDDYKWHSFELTVGYTIPKYKVRAKNSVTIQTFVRDLFTKKEKKDE